MKKYFIAFLMIICAASISQAAGGADYGRGAETDPVASALVTAVSGRVTTAESGLLTVSGRVSSVESGTNAWNGAVVNSSNWVDHASAMLAAVTNVLVTADTKTNTIIVVRGSIKSWTITE